MAATQRERVPSLRGYRDSLSAENRQLYDQKLKFTAVIDPYAISDNFYSQSLKEWPEIEFPDIVNYLMFSTSKVTKEQLKAYKSLQSYQYFVAGWVRCIFVGKATQNTTILIGKARKTFVCDVVEKILNCFDKFVSKFSTVFSYLSLLHLLR